VVSHTSVPYNIAILHGWGYLNIGNRQKLKATLHILT
jgi:hypothetical protein